MSFSCAVITVSDTCYNKTAIDKSGPALLEAIKENFPGARSMYALVPDSYDEIINLLKTYCEQNINLILTTGGTGLSKRDVTPEATKSIIEKEIPGITQTMLLKSLEITDMAMLSRAVAGSKNNSLIINLPGSKKGALECFGFIKSIIPHAIDLILDRKENIKDTHSQISKHNQENKDLKPNTTSKVKILPSALRNRTSQYEMISFDKAFNIVKDFSKNFHDIEEIPIEKSLDRVLACNIITNTPFPPFRASIKDGYAVIAADGAGERVVKTGFAAGDDTSGLFVNLGETVRVNTGGCVPEGADAVVQVEDTSLIEADEQGNEIKIMINKAPICNQDIRSIGSDISKSTILFREGETISSAHIGIFATLGHLKIKVYRRARVGLLSTGNEICSIKTENLKPGHIRDSNKLTLLNLLKTFGYTANDLGIIKDDPDLLKQALQDAFTHHDVIITTGGVSMGEYDLIKEILKVDFDATILFGRVNMKPGKPTTFATCQFNGSTKLIFALPGNPVSGTVTCRLFVIPSLRTYECSRNDTYHLFKARVNVQITGDDRWDFRRVKISELAATNPVKIATEVGNQISSRLNSCVGAQGLLIVPARFNTTNLPFFLDAIMLYR
ncbi:gephyrin [Onthophagus taurus]|uniref:gephyrin n=1 Tax=Onthophagus taurus TaxID=166361 RepID=UPI0039BDAF7B